MTEKQRAAVAAALYAAITQPSSEDDGESSHSGSSVDPKDITLQEPNKMLADFIQVTKATIQQLLHQEQALEDAQPSYAGNARTTRPTVDEEIQAMRDDEAIHAG